MSGLLVVALLAFAIPALAARVAPQIIGGRNARIGEFPWQGSLQRMGARMNDVDPYPGHGCGCVLISDTWLLSASHCFGQQPLYIVLGLQMSGNPTIGAPTGYYIQDLIIHPAWNPQTFTGDVALIRIQGRVQFNQFVRPIEMHAPGTNLDGAACTISGWGVRIPGQRESAIILQAADVRAVSVAECQQFLRRATEGNICVFVPMRSGACYGDSGGPCVCKGKLAGISSFGQPGCFPDKPSAYSRVSFFREWIRQVSGV